MSKPKVVKRDVVFQTGHIGVEAIEVDLGRKRKVIHAALYPDVTAVVPILDKNTVILAKEFRPTVNKTFLSVPGGKSGKGESLESSARRELLEEIGYECKSLKKMITYYPLVGLTTARLHIFVATGLKKAAQKLDDDEYISIAKVKLKDVPKLMRSGKIADSKTIIGLLMLQNR